MNALQKYVIAKAKIFKPFGEYVNEEDIAELGTWEPAIVEKIRTRIRTVLMDKLSCKGEFDKHARMADFTSILSAAFCPWCHYNNDPESEEFTEQDPSDLYPECDTCTYAHRHLQCSGNDSNWCAICAAALIAISEESPNIPTRKDIKQLCSTLKPQL